MIRTPADPAFDRGGAEMVVRTSVTPRRCVAPNKISLAGPAGGGKDDAPAPRRAMSSAGAGIKSASAVTADAAPIHTTTFVRHRAIHRRTFLTRAEHAGLNRYFELTVITCALQSCIASAALYSYDHHRQEIRREGPSASRRRAQQAAQERADGHQPVLPPRAHDEAVGASSDSPRRSTRSRSAR